jgi:hypothetical protein
MRCLRFSSRWRRCSASPLEDERKTSRHAGRGDSSAGAMRSVPLHRAAGNCAGRFIAATSDPVIRVPSEYHRRISARGTCRTHASVVAAGAGE